MGKPDVKTVYCERCDCIITEYNPLCKTTDTCRICRDEEFNMSTWDNSTGRSHAEIVLWQQKFINTAKELKEPEIQSDSYHEGRREFD